MATLDEYNRLVAAVEETERDHRQFGGGSNGLGRVLETRYYWSLMNIVENLTKSNPLSVSGRAVIKEGPMAYKRVSTLFSTDNHRGVTQTSWAYFNKIRKGGVRGKEYLAKIYSSALPPRPPLPTPSPVDNGPLPPNSGKS